MPDHFDVAREVVAAGRGRRDAWGFLRRFTESWATGLDELSGCDDQELTAAEHRLGLTLPPAVREGYELLGRRDDLTSNQDTLLRPDRLHLTPGTSLRPAGDAGLPDVGKSGGAAGPLVRRP